MSEAPPLTHKAGEKEVRMTYGLLTDFQRAVPNAEDAVSSIMSDPFIRDYLVRRALTDLKKSISDENELIAAEDVELTPDEVLSLIDWIAGHLLHFFLSSARSLEAQAKRLEPTGPSVPSKPGSKA